MSTKKKTKNKIGNKPPILISYESYNNNSKKKKIFWYVKDLKHTLNHYKLNSKGKKNELLLRLNDFFKNLSSYNNDINKIIKLQSYIKGYLIRKLIKLRGYGYLNKNLCNNDEDFYSFVNKNEIENKYFFSFSEKSNNNKNLIWFFDIRSLKKIIDNNHTNPFTTEEFSQKTLDKYKNTINYMKKHNLNYEYEKENLTPEQIYNNKVLSVFQKIDILNTTAGGTKVEWFHNLNYKQLRHFYKTLEDIWNYRAELNLNQKKEIVPKNNVFKNFNQALKLKQQHIRKLQNIILDDMDKLVSSAEDNVHKNTGAYYILIALTESSYDCALQMPWLIQAY